MSSEIPLTTLIVVVEIAIAVIVLLYSAYISFTIRRGLVVSLYRSRAFWLGILAILWCLFFIFFGHIGNPPTNTYVLFSAYHVVAGLVFYAGVLLPTLIVFLALIDRTNGTLILFDYRRKDILGWKKARPLYWLTVALFAVCYVIDLGPTPGYGYYQTNIPRSVISFTSSYGFSLLFIALAYGASVLVVGSIRTRDLTFRNHIKWLGLSLATFLALLLGFVSPDIAYLIGIVFAYFWFRMARLLVPVNKLGTNPSLEKGSSAS